MRRKAVDPPDQLTFQLAKKVTILWTTMQGQMREMIPPTPPAGLGSDVAGVVDHHDDLDVEVARVAGIECICSAGRV